MSWSPLLPFLDNILNEIEPGTLTETTLSKLHHLVPEKLILAALDLIDRGNVIHYATPWGHEEHQVLGSSGSYSVLVNLADSAMSTFTCTCPAFVYSVLLTQTHLLCKHVLATLIAQRLRQCIERPANLDDLEDLFRQQFSVNQGSPVEGGMMELDDNPAPEA
ncbi:hypothetical protein BJ165DRAFT_981387 [Panaeolus papilionaceus]|nr:hypothetical protein BJ165DRAFT_981387 [Panaeolus papilionaceus]